MSGYVYTFRDESGAPIYVGTSGSLGSRLNSHHRKPWWGEVARIEVDIFADVTEARAVERRRIDELLPKYNVRTSANWDNGTETRVARRELAHAFGIWCNESRCRACRLHKASA